MPLRNTQTELALQELSLPALWYTQKCDGIGQIKCQLQKATCIRYSAASAIPRRRTNPATAFEAIGGEQYLITSNPADHSLPGFNGIYLKRGDEERWLTHDALDAFRADFQGENPSALRDAIRLSWVNRFRFKDATSSPDNLGLRPPQLGGLYATLAHWSNSAEPATIVMPTGTGKTETMLSLLLAARPECVLVVVPSRSLRDQIAKKFITLGILFDHGIADPAARAPIVGVIENQFKQEADLEIFDRCNVVIAVVNSVAGGTSVQFLDRVADRCSHLVFDEAHHVPSTSWNRLKEAFAKKKVLQFTATPFREDRSPLGGKVIYNYPLRDAQNDGYFKQIKFLGVFEIEKNAADRAIAEKAIEQLRQDLAIGLNHRLLARCKSIQRAEEVLSIYEGIAPDLHPTIVNSKEADPATRIEELRIGNHKIVVTVDMLKEGFDMPELKVAAMHDVFKSLAVTLQFAGRFPRVGDDSVGTPTIVANTGFEEVAASLQDLYDEDANWNEILRDLSFEKVAESQRFEEFLHSSQDLSDGEISEDTIAGRLNKNTLVFKFNTVAYSNAKRFNQYGIKDGLENKHRFVRAWENHENSVVFFVTRLVDRPDWTKNKNIEDSILNLFVVYHDRERELLFIGSSHKSQTGHQRLAEAMGGAGVVRFSDEAPYRAFEGVEHLNLQQVGLLTGGGARNLRYSMFSGPSVKDAIAQILTSQSSKSNIYGTGYRDGRPIDLGCSRKGKIWCREAGSLNEWMEWCDSIGTRLLNTSFDTSAIMERVLIPQRVERLPDGKDPWFFEWPERLRRYKETSISIIRGESKYPFHRWAISLEHYDPASNSYDFSISHSDRVDLRAAYRLSIVGGNHGFRVSHLDGPELNITVGSCEDSLPDYLNEYPPILTYVDQSELEGALLVDPAFMAPSFIDRQCLVRDWGTTNQRMESRWKKDEFREESIQAQAMRWCEEEGFDIIFDDDGANEIADIVAIREEEDSLVIRLLHCKYSSSDDPGGRVKDITEVTSQAVKNFDWLWHVDKLAERMLQRHNDRNQRGASRFYRGSPIMLRKLVRLHREFRKTKNEVYVVQPGVAFSALTEQMRSIFGSADSFLRVRAGCPLMVWCS
ncbi:MAG: DEAD/DEAH box helicase family protein [Luteolibacter sp.]|nr:DEAD/DEAH box helicase family protein [Luteolibacter sp.]